MSGAPDSRPANQDRTFFGAITASLSHEINNVLAIINELTGLLSDYLAVAAGGRPVEPDKLEHAIGRIQVQLERGKQHVQQLNRFAHSVDNSRQQLDAREALEQTVQICQRFAALRKCELETVPPDRPVALTCCPFDLEHILFRCIDAGLGCTGAGQTLAVAMEPSAAGGARFVFEGRQPLEDAAAAAARIVPAEQVADALGCNLEVQAANGRPLRLELEVPAEMQCGADANRL